MTTVNKEPGEKILTLGKKGQTMELEIPLPPELMHALERKISDASDESFRLEAEMERKKDEVLKPIKDAIKGVKERERELVDQRARGVMTARVPVETRANTFRKEKWLVRLDTGEEVPDTRRALTDEDLQTLLPGVVLEGDNRPDAPVLNLFAQKQEPETAPTDPWRKIAPAPYEDWHLSEVQGKDGEHLYMVARGPVDNPSRAWGPFGYAWSEGFHPPGEPAGTLGDDVRRSMADALGLEDRNDGGERIPAEDSPDLDNLLTALEAVADERVAALEAKSLPPAPDGGLNLYEAGGHPGWGAYMHEGQLWIRPPNVDRFEPARSPKDKGPLEWDKAELRFDGVKGANVTSAWLNEHDKLLAEFDFLKKTGKITEPVKELLEAQTSAAAELLPEVDGVDDAALSPGEAAASDAGGSSPDVSTLAAKLTDNGRKLLKALVTSGPNGSARLGNMTGCGKPGAALKHLQKHGLVSVRPPGPGEASEMWDITDLGKRVHEQATK